MWISKWLSLVSQHISLRTCSSPRLHTFATFGRAKEPKRWDLFLDMTVYITCCIVFFFAPQRKMASLHLADGLHNNNSINPMRSGPQMVLAWNKRRGRSPFYTIEMQGVESINVIIRVRVKLRANLDTEFKLNVASARFGIWSTLVHDTAHAPESLHLHWSMRNICVINRSNLFVSPREMCELSVMWRHCMRWHFPQHCVLSQLHLGFHIASTRKIQVV